MPEFIRIKLPNAEVVEVDIASIFGFDIHFDDEDNTYSLCAYGKGAIFLLAQGNFNDCHLVLNKLHSLLKIKIIDL